MKQLQLIDDIGLPKGVMEEPTREKIEKWILSGNYCMIDNRTYGMLYIDDIHIILNQVS